MDSIDENLGETLMQKERELLDISRQRYAHLEDKLLRKDIEIQGLTHKVSHLNQDLTNNLHVLESKDRQLTELYQKIDTLKYTFKEKDVEISELRAYLSAAEQRLESEVQNCRAKESKIAQNHAILQKELAQVEEIRESQKTFKHEEITSLKRQLKKVHREKDEQIESLRTQLACEISKSSTTRHAELIEVENKYEEMIELLQRDMNNLSNQLRLAQDTAENLKAWYDDESRKQEKTYKQIVADRESTIQRLQSQTKSQEGTQKVLEEDYKREIAQLQMQITDLDWEVDTIKQERRNKPKSPDLSQHDEALARAKRKLARRTRQKKELEDIIRQQEAQITTLESRIKETRTSQHFQRPVSSSPNPAHEYKRQVWDLEATIESLNNEANHHKERRSKLQAEVVDLRSELNKWRETLDEHFDWSQAKAQLKEANETIQTLQSDKRHMAARMMSSTEEGSMKDRLAYLELELSTLRVSNENLETKLSQCLSDRSSLELNFQNVQQQVREFDKENLLLNRSNERLQGENGKLLAERDQLLEISSNLRAEQRTFEYPADKIEELENRISELSQYQRAQTPTATYIDSRPIGQSERETESQRHARLGLASGRRGSNYRPRINR